MKKTKKLVMSWLLAFCCVITLVAPSVVNAAADDSRSSMIQTHVLYIQTVMQITADGNRRERATLPLQSTGATRQARHWTLHSTEQNWSFTVKKAANHAMFSVSIDGSEAVECDAYAAVTEPEAKLFESKTLAAGNHTAHITVLEKRNEASTGTGSVYGVQFVYAKALRQRLRAGISGIYRS